MKVQYDKPVPHSSGGVGPIILVAMPWAMSRHPSIQIGLLHAILQENRIDVVSRSLFLEFLDYGVRQSFGNIPLTVDDYEKIAAHHHHLGEWVFSGPPLVQEDWTTETYLSHLRQAGFSPELIQIAREFRRYVPAFLDEMAISLLDLGPTGIGFTTTFGQTIPSLQLALRIKALSPAVQIVFGGANCEGNMGKALIGGFDCIDVIVQGEGEKSAVLVFDSIFRGGPMPSAPGVVSREQLAESERTNRSVRATFVDLNESPTPNYDEYFTCLHKSAFRDKLMNKVFLPFETSRGCWWGMKVHCTFCGLNADTMFYRSKSSERVKKELVELAERYGVLNFAAVDNILNRNYFDTLLPRLQDTGFDFRIFFEVKANMTKKQIRALRDAGILDIQPGLESLSTPILRLMKKGTSALQNIRLLKWCSELQIGVHWNLIIGFPGENPAEYDKMARLIPSLVHLDPPTLTTLGVERFSPYHSYPEQYGLRILGATPFYRFSYPCGEEVLMDLAYAFDYEHVDGRDPMTYSALLRSAVMRWNISFDRARREHLLSYRRGPDFIAVADHRFDQAREIVLDRRDAAIFEACDAGATVEQIRSKLCALDERTSYTNEEIEKTLSQMEASSLLFSEDGKFLALAPRASLDEGRDSWN